MQDTLDITGAGYECDFIWFYTGYSILVHWKDTTQVYTAVVWLTGVQKCEPPPWLEPYQPHSIPPDWGGHQWCV